MSTPDKHPQTALNSLFFPLCNYVVPVDFRISTSFNRTGSVHQDESVCHTGPCYKREKGPVDLRLSLSEVFAELLTYMLQPVTVHQFTHTPTSGVVLHRKLGFQFQFCQSPGEIKRREASWTLTKKLDFHSRVQARSRGGRWCWTLKLAQRRSRAGRCSCMGLRVGLPLLQLFPNGGATDIDFVTLFCIAVGTAIAWCGGRCAMPDGHVTALKYCCSGGGPRQPWSSGLAPGFTLLSPFPPLVPVPNRPTGLRGR